MLEYSRTKKQVYKQNKKHGANLNTGEFNKDREIKRG